MAIQRIRIEQQLAQIGVRGAGTPAKLNINIPKGHITIKNVRPEMQIEKQNPSFKVDKRKQYNESGLKAPLDLTKDFRNEGKQTAIRATGQAKSDGNFLARAGLSMAARDVVPQLAKQKANARLGPKEYNIGLMPQTKPDITWNKGYVKINWSKHSVIIDYTGEYMPQVSAESNYPVEVYLRQRPYFRVMVEEAVSSRGQHVDQAV